MFSLAIIFFCQSLIQFLKDAFPLSTGNMHHIVGVKQPPVQWLLQCLQQEAAHLLTGTARVHLCCRRCCRGHGLALWLLSALTAGMYTLGKWGVNYLELREILLNMRLEEKRG